MEFFFTMQAMAIAGNIRAAFIDNLEKEHWMDYETRKAAKRKVKNLNISQVLTVSWFRAPV